jgi:hypothetical protein
MFAGTVVSAQAWSALADPVAFPDTLEFEGPPGIIAARFPQFRYTQPLNRHHSVGISVEKSGTDVPFSTQFGMPHGTSKWPDLIAVYLYENNWGQIQASTLFRNVGGIIPSEQVFIITWIPERTNRTGHSAVCWSSSIRGWVWRR